MRHSWKQAARFAAIVAFALFFMRNPLWGADISSELSARDVTPASLGVPMGHWAPSEASCEDNADQWICQTRCPSSPRTERWWFDAEYLLFWTNGDRVPPLVSTNATLPPRSEAGVLGVGDTAVLVDGQLDEDARRGVALSAGYWLDDCQSCGIRASWFYVGDPFEGPSDVWASTGEPVLARPFFNVGSGLEDSQLVAYPNVVAGTVRVDTSSNLRSAETLLVTNLLQGCRGRVDLLGGYRYLRFREGILIEEHLSSTDPGGFIPVGTTIDLFDDFTSSNSFHGAEIGLMATRERGRCEFGVATKLGIGNVRRRVNVNGMTAVTTPGGTRVVSTGGLLALPSNIGRYQNDHFGLLPELNLNARLRLTEHLSANVGYNLLFLNDVYRAGSQIDRSVNTGQLPGGLPVNGNIANGLTHPAVLLDSSTLCVQGLNVGFTLAY